MKKIICLLGSLCAVSANAALINLSGDIAYHNDVVSTSFTLENDASNVRIWTDSFRNGLNFDPITALWDAEGSLIAQNDDNQSINPSTQTRFDSGFMLSDLASGDYVFTISTYNNFANGGTLADGFKFDDQTPILLSEWQQPSSHVGMGTHWNLWLDGADSATTSIVSQVPESSSLSLLILGLFGLGFYRKKR